jgi:VCBS repeat-containing protein
VRQLDAEIAYLRSLLSAADQAVGAMEHDTAVRSAIYQASAAVNSHSTASLDNACVTLSSLLLSTGADVSQSDLDALMAERRQLSAGADDGLIAAPEAGVFTAAVDGFEALTPDMLDGLTPDAVRGFASEKQNVAAGTFGKLITAKKWYYAAVMNEADAQRLSVGDETTLDFGRHSADALSATVRSISEPADGECAVVFTVKSGVAETAALRETGCEIVFSSHTGLRVPLRAVRFIDTEEGQAPVVYVITAERMEMKRVEILYEGEDYVILARGTGKNALRAGNEVIVDGKGLEDGKAITR